jgi:hypothetical protein
MNIGDVRCVSASIIRRCTSCDGNEPFSIRYGFTSRREASRRVTVRAESSGSLIWVVAV